ncbi:hypothetical protein SAMN05421736_107140 [Evansella caseinilytica]|uniref:Uncharacterized protein n=1 Tax=Evansella caseinilytica TaxID=1503961 RepID=A0A1H3R1U6_9BACI|nr:hypothetical protein [Evansella caseinilytica]SDZ19271.1 hypothetical protein SAMN05421736_107140 [Evansella caseinilytica]
MNNLVSRIGGLSGKPLFAVDAFIEDKSLGDERTAIDAVSLSLRRIYGDAFLKMR